MSDDMDELADLERQLLFLKKEEERLSEQVQFEMPADNVVIGSLNERSTTKTSPAVHPLAPKSSIETRSSYSTVDPIKGDVRGFKRARLIRRVGAVVALGMAVVAAVTVASSGDLEVPASLLMRSSSEQLYDSAASQVPEALESDSGMLTDGQKILFENRYEHLLDSERRHQEWDEERAAHLVRQISAASEQNYQVELNHGL